VDLLHSADRSVDAAREELIDLSHAIHADAEVGFEEHTSSQRVADALQAAGFAVTHGIGDLDTAVVAEFGDGPLTVAICAEYDALPASVTPAGTTSSPRPGSAPPSRSRPWRTSWG